MTIVPHTGEPGTNATLRTLTELFDARVAASAERSSFPEHAVDTLVLEEVRALALDRVAYVGGAHDAVGDGDERRQGEANTEVHLGTGKSITLKH